MQMLLAQPHELCETFSDCLKEGLLRKWYPLVIDRECGGYFTNVTFDWRLSPEQEKMIVTQARHIWTTAKAAGFVANGAMYEAYARHGLEFLRTFMWDGVHGGFFQIRSRQGGYSECEGWREEKRTNGQAYAIYAIAGLHRLTKDPSVLDFAKEAFRWVEEHAYDPSCSGYFQFLTRDGEPFDATSRHASVASDRRELGCKDHDSSIHLLEAYTELYNVWKNDTLKERLSALLHLIRDRMVTHSGHLQLLFERDWTPVSARNTCHVARTLNSNREHVSFGHECEAAYLMLEASHALGIENDARTLSIAKRMLEHAVLNGWDEHVGGLYDAGYYLEGSDQCSAVKKTKSWWVQAEALNALLIFSRIFPHDEVYRELFEKLWAYIDKYLLDHQNGDWFEAGLDTEPHFITGPKSHMWKCTHHTGRALMNCIAILSDADRVNPKIGRRKTEMERLINHWKKT